MSAARTHSISLYVVNAASSVTTQLLQLTVLVWVNQHLLKRIAPEEYSLLPLVMSLIIFADVLKHVMIGGLSRYIVEADARHDADGVTTIVSSMLPVLVIGAALFGLGGAVAAWRLDHLLKIEPAYLRDAQLMLLILVGTQCIGIVATPFTVGLYARQRFVVQNAMDLGCEVLRVLILLGLLMGVGTKVLWLVVASSIAAFVNVALRIRATRRLLPAARFRRDHVSFATARKLMSFGAWTSLQAVTDLVSKTVPLLILNRFATAVDVASFHLGRMPDQHLRRLANAASLPAQPALTSIYATKGAGSLDDIYYRGGRYHLWVTLCIVAPLLVLGREIVALYAGHNYIGSATVILGLLCAYPLLWASAMFYRVAHAIGHVRAYYTCDIIVQLTALVTLWYAVRIRGWGAPGAGLAIGITGGLLHVFLVWPMGLRLVRGRWSRFFRETVLPGMLPFAGAVLTCLTFKAFLRLDSWLAIGAVCLAAGLVYVALLTSFCLDATDRDLIGRALRRFRRPAQSAPAEIALEKEST